MPARIPAHVVAGSADALGLISRLCAARADWIGLVSTLPLIQGPNIRTIAAGCPCCTGKVVLQVSLARALRESRATRVFVQVADTAHATALEKALSEFPLGLSVTPGRRILLPQDGALGPGELESA